MKNTTQIRFDLGISKILALCNISHKFQNNFNEFKLFCYVCYCLDLTNHFGDFKKIHVKYLTGNNYFIFSIWRL